MESIHEPMFNCHKCKTEYDDRPDPEVLTERKRVIKSCYKIADQDLYQKSVFNFRQCIGNYANQWAYSAIDLFMRYDKFGTLPFEGGVADQPYKVIQLFQIIESLRSEKAKESEVSQNDMRVLEKIQAKRAREGQ